MTTMGFEDAQREGPGTPLGLERKGCELSCRRRGKRLLAEQPLERPYGMAALGVTSWNGDGVAQGSTNKLYHQSQHLTEAT